VKPPRMCPKFDTCSAPYCPLDPDRSHTTTHKGEPSCLYLREAVKADGRVPEQLREAVADALPLVLNGNEGGYGLRKALNRAALQGSSRSRATAV
jgi:hypothetical protein